MSLSRIVSRFYTNKNYYGRGSQTVIQIFLKRVIPKMRGANGPSFEVLHFLVQIIYILVSLIVSEKQTNPLRNEFVERSLEHERKDVVTKHNFLKLTEGSN